MNKEELEDEECGANATNRGRIQMEMINDNHAHAFRSGLQCQQDLAWPGGMDWTGRGGCYYRSRFVIEIKWKTEQAEQVDNENKEEDLIDES